MAIISEFRPVGKIINVPSIIHAFPCGTGSPIDDEGSEFFEIPEAFLTGVKEAYIIEARGDSMTPKINHGDRLIIDHLSEPNNNDAVVAYLNGDFLVKYFTNANGQARLVASNKKYKPIEINENDDFHILGVVKWVLSSPAMDT